MALIVMVSLCCVTSRWIAVYGGRILTQSLWRLCFRAIYFCSFLNFIQFFCHIIKLEGIV